MSFDLIQTVALAGVVLFAGYSIRPRHHAACPTTTSPRRSWAACSSRSRLTLNRAYVGYQVKFDRTLQSPLMIAFFTTIGFGASVALLRVGSPAVVIFFLFSTVMAFAPERDRRRRRDGARAGPVDGRAGGSVTLTGGPATGLAFAPELEAAGVPAAATLAVAAAARVGIVSGGILGGPIGTYLVRRSPGTRLKTTPMAVRGP